MERVYTIPLRNVKNVKRTIRAPRAIREVKNFLTKHMKAEDVKIAFNHRFFKNGVYEHGNQANYGMALYYGLVDSENIPMVAKALADAVKASNYSIKTGEIGLRPTIMALAANGYNEVVYRMANKTTYPSYG